MRHTLEGASGSKDLRLVAILARSLTIYGSKVSYCSLSHSLATAMIGIVSRRCMHQHTLTNSTYTYTDILTEGRPELVMLSFCVAVSRVSVPR